jgi:hypothetical protein
LPAHLVILRPGCTEYKTGRGAKCLRSPGRRQPSRLSWRIGKRRFNHLPPSTVHRLPVTDDRSPITVPLGPRSHSPGEKEVWGRADFKAFDPWLSPVADLLPKLVTGSYGRDSRIRRWCTAVWFSINCRNGGRPEGRTPTVACPASADDPNGWCTGFSLSSWNAALFL